MSTKAGLGRGLGSLIPEGIDAGSLVNEHEQVEQVSLELLEPGQQQPRTVFDQAALAELAASLKRHGVVQPLVVSRSSTGRYQIIAGERRWRAAHIARLKTVPVIVRTLREQERLEVALIENVQRIDLAPMEQAVSIERLHQQFNLSYTDIAKRLGKAETTVSNIVRLLQLPPRARQALEKKQLSEGHARQVLALKDLPAKQDELIDFILRRNWSVRQAEQFVSSVKAGYRASNAAQKRMAPETPETKRLSKRYGVPVRVRRTARGGCLELVFRSDEELRALFERLSHPS